MENIVGIIAAVVLAASSYLAYQNMTSFKGHIEERDNENRRLDRNKRTFAELEEELKEEEEELEAKKEELVETETKLQEQLSKNSEIESRASEMKTEAEEKEEEAEKATAQLEELGDVEELVRELRTNQIALARLEGEILLKKETLEKLTAQDSSLQSNLQNQRGIVDQYRKKQSNPDLKAKVSRVFYGVGFVVLSAGDNKGVVQDSVLNVMRGGKVVGKLQVSAVEASTSSADIIPESFQDGDRVRTGDLVVAGEKEG